MPIRPRNPDYWWEHPDYRPVYHGNEDYRRADLPSRRSIFKAATRKSPLADDISIDELADRTDGFSGADITEVCQRSAKLAIRQHIFDSDAGLPTESSCREISRAHFDSAMQVARRSVSASDVKKFERFKKSMQVQQKS